ncbi:hypothetical protein MNBD_ALPHA09-22 [hydrothermal vent metagenome]|uniref:Uncharacterized protein n=1 Tax=hydrothermal vent metagenome TaxID=652676 RepID=A0A3B0TDG3_9ZZZZ
MVPQTGLKGTGVLVPVVGPDGAEKATLIASARGTYSGNSAIVFAKPLVAASGLYAGPDHPVSPAEFSALKAAGAFAVSWQGKDGSHGLPVSIFDDLTDGRVVVAAVSRSVIPQLRRRHSRVHVIYLNAGRSGHPQAGGGIDIPEPPVTVIDNSGPLTEAVEDFLGVLETYVPMSS